MTSSCGPAGRDSALLQVELVEVPRGYLARFRGDLVAETTGVLWGIEPILLNETRVSLDFSGVTSVDQAGLKATLNLVEALHACGGRLTIGAQSRGRSEMTGNPPLDHEIEVCDVQQLSEALRHHPGGSLAKMGEC